MKENEVMIGDWFRFRYTIDGKEIVHTFRISRIEDELGEYYVWGDGFGRMCYPKRLEPIPITPEILEKNGFVMAERDGVAVRYSFATDLHKPTQTAIQFAFYDGGVSADTLFKCWTSPKDCDGINDLHICDLKFVHELQHAIRLAGIDKEIII